MTILVDDIQERNNATATAFMAAMMMPREWPTMHQALGIRHYKSKPEHPCALPGCEEMTTHNGGYCCAEHFKEHKARSKTRNCIRQSSSRPDSCRASRWAMPS